MLLAAKAPPGQEDFNVGLVQQALALCRFKFCRRDKVVSVVALLLFGLLLGADDLLGDAFD